MPFEISEIILKGSVKSYDSSKKVTLVGGSVMEIFWKEIEAPMLINFDSEFSFKLDQNITLELKEGYSCSFYLEKNNKTCTINELLESIKNDEDSDLYQKTKAIKELQKNNIKLSYINHMCQPQNKTHDNLLECFKIECQKEFAII